MGVPTYAQLTDIMLDAMQANVATDAPFTAAELLRHFVEAQQTVWEIESGGVKKVAGGTAWVTQPTADATGILSGKPTDIETIEQMWATLTSGSTGGGSGDVLLDRKERAEIQSLRARSTGLGTYTVPKFFAITRQATTTDADVGKVLADVWPGVAAYYFPIEYTPQFTPVDGATITVPDLTDIGARDAALIAAMTMAPLIGRAELVPSIALKVSDRTQQALARKQEALLAGKQDRP